MKKSRKSRRRVKKGMVKKNGVRLIVLVVLMSALVYFLVNYYYAGKRTGMTDDSRDGSYSIESQKRLASKQPSSAPANSPTPKPIPHGKRGFTVSLGNKVLGPKMGKGYVNPYDPVIGATQNLTIEVNNFDQPIDKVVAVLQTDNQTSPEYVLEQIDGNANKGNWSGNWTVDDTYLYTYLLTIAATGPNGTSKVTVTLR